jgi:hypothetical protein
MPASDVAAAMGRKRCDRVATYGRPVHSQETAPAGKLQRTLVDALASWRAGVRSVRGSTRTDSKSPRIRSPASRHVSSSRRRPQSAKTRMITLSRSVGAARSSWLTRRGRARLGWGGRDG